MTEVDSRVVVVGAGLSGLCAAIPFRESIAEVSAAEK